VEGLQITWYLVIVLALMCYSMLDGFDLGVGTLHLFSKKDEHRRIFLNAIGPVWDGNEVWLVIVGGALFAGFPDVYATIFSAFYVPCMVLLCALIFRAVAIEFRSKLPSPKWRHTWDVTFSIASIIIAFCVGVVFTNLVQGIPINQEKIFIGSFWNFFTPYTILGGITVISLFMMHGTLYLLMKTEGTLHESLRTWVKKAITFFIICYGILTCMTLLFYPHMSEKMLLHPPLFIFPFVTLFFVIIIPFLTKHQKDGLSFVFSCLSIIFLFILFGLGTFPVMVRSSINPEQFSLTLFNAASSMLTLKVLLIIVIIGIPFVLAYGFYLYRVFRGKVTLDSSSY
jgi:cytochrome bd ubiquinol oxidase subunit II